MRAMKGFEIKCINGHMRAADVTSLDGTPRIDIYQLRLYAGSAPRDVELEVVLDNRKTTGEAVEVIHIKAAYLSFTLRVEDAPDEEAMRAAALAEAAGH